MVRIVIWILVESRDCDDQRVRRTVFLISDLYYTLLQMCHDRELPTLRLDGDVAKAHVNRDPMHHHNHSVQGVKSRVVLGHLLKDEPDHILGNLIFTPETETDRLILYI